MGGLRHPTVCIGDPVFLFQRCGVGGGGLAQIGDWGLGECSLTYTRINALDVRIHPYNLKLSRLSKVQGLK